MSEQPMTLAEARDALAAIRREHAGTLCDCFTDAVEALAWALDQLEKATPDSPRYETGYASTIRSSQIRTFSPVQALMKIAILHGGELRFTRARNVLEHAGVIECTPAARADLYRTMIQSGAFVRGNEKGLWRLAAQEATS